MSNGSPTFTRPRKRRQRPLGWLAAVALSGAIFLLYETVGESGYVARREQQQRIQELRAQVDQLQKENERLTRNIHGLRSDPAAIEEMAREQLHLARPDEFVVSLPPASGSAAAP